MSGTYRVPAGSVTLTAFNVDDGAGIYLDGDKVRHVDFGQSAKYQFTLDAGETREIRFEIWNVTGGPFRADFNITGPRGKVWSAAERGNTLPGVNIAWDATITLIGV